MFGSLKKRLSKSFNRATEILSFSGPNPAKQFRNAIIDGDEEKALVLYLTLDGEKCLKDELPPCAPFPTKKNTVSETPLYLASKHALQKLVKKLLELGGDPSLTSIRNETCVHVVCSLPDRPEVRAAILELLVSWEGVQQNGLPMDKVSINRVDDDGNCAIHYAASNGLAVCVERLITYGAIISIVNKNNLTCCEMADEKNHKTLASMLELALVFQPEDKSMEGINIFGNDFDTHDTGKLFLDTRSLSTAGLNSFMEETITIVSRYLGWMNARLYRSRAEALLTQFAWNGEKLIEEYLKDQAKVLADAKMVVSSSANQSGSKSGSKHDMIADLGEVSIQLSSEEEEVGMCMICGDTMYCSQDVNQFIKNNVTKPDQRALSCLSGHTFCTSCWSSHLIVQVNDNGLGCLPCPGYKCGEILDISWAPIMLKSQEAVNRLKLQRQRNVIDCAGLKMCPIENCGLIVYVPSATTPPTTATSGTTTNTATPTKDNSSTTESVLPRAAVCANGHCFCLSCMQPAHSPCGCNELPSWLKLIAEETQTANVKGGSSDEIANALWVAANTKRCPRCSTAIEKDEGCNHMTCRKCRKEFCWICMQDWSLHSDNTGGYFQCNRFLETNNNGNNVGSGNGSGRDSDLALDPFGDDIWGEERGNAHAETMRLRERNRRMGRFIHHFTRYQAHGQSYQMEARMHKETLKRITESLRLTREGKLLWLQGSSTPIPQTTTTTNDLLSLGSTESTQGKPSATPNASDKEANPLLAAIEEAQKSNATNETVLEKQTAISHEKGNNGKEDSLHENIKNHFLLVDPSLEFLTEGFEELIKCRQFLQWTYPYAYFEFQEIDDNDYSTNTRRNMWMRSRSQDHRTTFEFLQSDLEGTVETLSDVVARRRLRASQNQITQATQAAKQKRVEFESFLSSYAAAKASTAASPNTPAMNRLDALTSRSNARSRLRQQNRSRPHSRFAEALSDHRDLNALLLELELANSLGEDGSGSLPASRTRGNNPYYSMSTTTDRSPTLRRRGHRSRRNRNTQSTTQRRHPLLDHSGSSSSLDTPNNDQNPSATQEEGETNDYDEDDDIEEDTINLLRLTTAVDNDRDALSGFNDYQLTRLAQHAEEEAELNRAILMSLQYASTDNNHANSNPAPPPAGRDGGEMSSPIEAGGEDDREGKVATLTAMGFTREQSVQALREARGNVEMAANRLLGLDM